MTTATETSELITKVKELCEAILEDAKYNSLMENVEAFLENDAARDQYRAATELGQDLQQKQRMGEELAPAAIKDFEAKRDALFDNSVIAEFISAQRELGDLQSLLTSYVEKTIELGRVPEPEELVADEGGCCGGGGGGGCGCHH